jgi:hypothetical protein
MRAATTSEHWLGRRARLESQAGADLGRNVNVRRVKAPVIVPKGQRYPGSGRVKGTPNRVSVELKTLVSELVNDAAYQHRLRQDFQRRRLHPTIEALVWAYALGKPRQDIQVSGSLDITARVEEERRIFAQLDLPELEALAARSQALIDEATATVKARNGGELPVIEGTFAPQKDVEGRNTAECGLFPAGSDKVRNVNCSEPSDDIALTPADTGDSEDGNT